MEHEPTELAPSVAARFGARFVARVIDLIAGMGAAFCGGILAGLVLASLEMAGKIPHGWSARLRSAYGLTLLWSLVGGFLYHSVAEGFGGATVGKLVLGLRVVNERGAPCDVTAAVVRSSAYLLDAQLVGLVGFLKMKRSVLQQRFGDVWGHTVVVRAAMLPPTSRRSTGALALSIGTGLVLFATCMAVGMVLSAV